MLLDEFYCLSDTSKEILLMKWGCHLPWFSKLLSDAVDARSYSVLQYVADEIGHSTIIYSKLIVLDVAVKKLVDVVLF